ncbi:unnamed protein product [Calypogeia fissa]
MVPMCETMADTSFDSDMSLGRTCGEFRKRAKTDHPEKDDSGGEETREETHHLLTADIWEKLPECLIEEVLAKLPFSSLFRFCCACKRWRDTILSGNPHLAFFRGGKLLVLNPNRRSWESVPISFLPVDRLSSLSLVAAAGGLLCFRTKSFDEFLVCNPLTRSWRTVQTPWGEAAPSRLDPLYSTTALRKFHRCKSMPKFFLVGVILNSDETHFNIVVASGVTRGERVTLVYDSYLDCWEKADGVPDDSGPEGGGGFHEAQTIASRGNLYSTIRTTSDEVKLVKFDVEQRTWSTIQMPDMPDLPWKLLEHNGKILLMSGNPRNPSSFAFYELKDSEITPWVSLKSLRLIRLFEAMRRGFGVSENLRILDCLGQGDSMFCIGSKFSTAQAALRSRSGSSRLSFTAGVHNFSTNSDVLTGWEEPQMGGCQSSFPGSWQIFRPSLLPCIQGGR